MFLNDNLHIFIEGHRVENGEEALVGGLGIMEVDNVVDGGFGYGTGQETHGMGDGYGAGSEGGAGGLRVGYGSGLGISNLGIRTWGMGNSTKCLML